MKKNYYDICEFIPSEDEIVRFYDEGGYLDSEELISIFNEISQLVHEDSDELVVKIPADFELFLYYYDILCDINNPIPKGLNEDGFWHYISNWDEVWETFTEKAKEIYEEKEFVSHLDFKDDEIEFKLSPERNTHEYYDFMSFLDDLWPLTHWESLEVNHPELFEELMKG